MCYYLFSDSTFITQTSEFLLGIHHLTENFYFLDFSLGAGYGIWLNSGNWSVSASAVCNFQVMTWKD